jgi:hypothetical protein
LSWNHVTGKGIEHLTGMKNLRYMYLFDTRVTSEELRRLRELFPNTVIYR